MTTLMGLPVVDATEDLEFTIRKGDKRGARRLDPNGCVMQKALSRQHGTGAVLAYRSKIYVEKDGVLHRYDATAQLSQQVIAYDQGADFLVGTYTAKVPQEKLGVRHTRRTKPDERPNHQPKKGAIRHPPTYIAHPRREIPKLKGKGK